MRRGVLNAVSTVLLLIVAALAGCDGSDSSGKVRDEALLAGRDAASFPAADEDYFKDMDGGLALTKEEVQGRNMWLVWTGGNDRFWDVLTNDTAGAFDLLKIVSSHPGLKFSRDNRWNYLGLVNEPCYDKPTEGDRNRFGLWLDQRHADCAPDPFENAAKYPGVKIGARGGSAAGPVGSYYGYATGIVGLRLFPNPAFDDKAKANWNAERFYNDPDYYLSKDLVRPYRVGMSCGFCHVGPSPTHPPADPENPKWENLSSTVGAQYFWIDRIFVWNADPSNFVYQLLHTSRPGALDTSLVSTDSIVNPRTMNAIYNLWPRMQLAHRWGEEKLAGGELNNKQFNDFVSNGPLTEFFQKPNTVQTPHVLKDASDSVGGLGALNRVYLNIGLFSEEWLLHFNAFVGGKPITPIEIAVAEKNSNYWKATEAQTLYMAEFLLRAGQPDYLKDAPGGTRYLTADPAVLERGKSVFAERCARCHSSKLPAPAQGVDPSGCAGRNYLACWNRYWTWTKTDDFKQKMTSIVKAPDFLDGNYLSSELRVPVTLLQTNACSPLATNAIAGNIWDNFSSESYKELPSVGTVTIYNPFTGEPRQFPMPAGGRGYTRPASLVSLWSTAPFLLNNTVGKFNPSPSVDARMASFQDGIEQMLWPEKRAQDPVLGEKIPGPSMIDRTTERSWLRVPIGYLPDSFAMLRDPLSRLFPSIFRQTGFVAIGPIPKGTPVDLIGNLDVLSDSPDPAERLARAAKVAGLLAQLKHDLKVLPADASDEDARKIFVPLRDRLFELSKCPDFVVNRGHYFGTSMFAEEPELSDDEKRALIEYLKTL